MVKKFTINCDFGGQMIPVSFSVGNPSVDANPIEFQSRWLSKEKGGVVPQNIVDAFMKLKEISEKNKIPLEDLCEQVIGEAQSNSTFHDDAKKASEFSSSEN